MNKVVCNICGTSYPESAKQCPICGSIRPGDVQRITNEVKSNDSYITNSQQKLRRSVIPGALILHWNALSASITFSKGQTLG